MANNPLLKYTKNNQRQSVPMFLREYSRAESRRETPRRETPQQIARRAPNAVEIAAEEAARKAQIGKVRQTINRAVADEMSRPPQQRRDVANIGRSDPSRRGKFLQRAYADYQAPTPETGILSVMGLERDPLLNVFDPMRVKRATKKFKETHKWARDQKNAADLDVAVKYLLSKPRYEKVYYAP
jgi:hypothetical protein